MSIAGVDGDVSPGIALDLCSYRVRRFLAGVFVMCLALRFGAVGIPMLLC